MPIYAKNFKKISRIKKGILTHRGPGRPEIESATACFGKLIPNYYRYLSRAIRTLERTCESKRSV